MSLSSKISSTMHRDKFFELLSKLKKCMRLGGHSREDLIVYHKQKSYGRYFFEGAYTDLLVYALERDPTADEIIMIVDNSVSHLSGSRCSVDPYTQTFYGTVNTD